MRNSEPLRLSTWLLERLAPRHRRESLVGDLHEQMQRGCSAWWYRRQVFGTILAGLTADVAAHKLLAVRALAIGWSAMYLLAMEIRRLLETDLWPGWGWGSFRWALVYQALLSFVAYPLCVVIGGLWSLRADDGSELHGHSDAVFDES